MQPLRILLADDNFRLRKRLAQLLRRHDHTVVTAGSGSEALEQYSPGRFDIVLLDVMMPGLNGLEVASRVRVRDASQKVVMLTGAYDDDTFDDAHTQHVDAFLYKPYQAERVLDCLEQVRQGKRMLQVTVPA